MRLTSLYHVVHNTYIKHGRDIKTRYIGSTSILLLTRELDSLSDSIECNHSFKKHFPAYCIPKGCQTENWRSLIRKSIHVTSTSAKDLIEAPMEKRIGFGSCSTTRRRSCSTTRRRSCLDKQNFSNSKSNS